METFEDVLKSLAARTPAPGGGAAAAWACALGAALVEMAAAFAEDAESAARASELRTEALSLAVRDGEAYASALAARRRAPRDDAQVAAAMAAAAEPPLLIAEAGAETAELAAAVAVMGKPTLKGDALTGALLAEAGARAAARLAEMDLDAAGHAAPPGMAARAHVATRRAAAARDQALG
jgi:formiminotetrahydrofolate cyclodeaminase